ncbi:MAG TPA: DUF5916 domain-containing protein, partial [Longimicrobium sp.]|nr:DUF5916 domain-containing protein [Longimicrobium sp.]
ADRTWTLSGAASSSYIQGDSLAINVAQRTSARYLQRPDADHLDYDPTRTSLSGAALLWMIGKMAGGHWRFATGSDVRSPGFEVNDLGFLPRADYVWNNVNVIRRWIKPTRYRRGMTAIVGSQQQVNWDGDLTSRDLHAYVGAQLPNYWEVSAFTIWTSAASDDRLTRGGPVVRTPADMLFVLGLSTDSRKKVVLSSDPRYSRDTEGGWSWQANLGVRVKPASNVQFSLSPTYGASRGTAQFVASFADPTATHFHGQRVVFSDLEQHSLSMDTRLNWTFSPTLTLELFAQPYVATGSFDGFKEFVRPRSIQKTEFDAQQLAAITQDGRVVGYTIDPDRDAATENFEFGNPDFNFRSLRGNAVLRWEYRPGSTLFLVWQQQRSGVEPFGSFDFGRDAPGVFNAPPDNVFVVKMSYWFGR